jgi:hypothetical protein
MEVNVPKGWSESFVEELTLLSLLGFEPWICSAFSPVSMPTLS